MADTMNLPPRARSINLRAESFDADANTIDVVFTTGAAVQRFDWDGGYLETLDVTAKAVRLDRLNLGAPFLNTHWSYDLSQVLGSVVPSSARIEGGEGLATIKLSSAVGDADIISKIRDGVIRNVSVGYIIHQVIRTEGKDGAMATCRVTDWEPIEISAVPIPADASAQIRAAGGKPGDITLYPCLVRGDAAAASSVAIVEAARARRRMRARHLGLLSA